MRHIPALKMIIFSFILPLGGFAQDVTGLWTGYISSMGNQLPYDLVITRNEDKFSGYSLTTFTIEGVENTGMKSMKIKVKKDKVTIEDDELIDDNYSTKSKRVMVWSVLSLSIQDTVAYLTGTFNSRSYNNPSYKGTIHLRRKKNYTANKLMARLTQLGRVNELSFLSPEKNAKIVVSSTTAVKDPEPKKGNQFAVIPAGKKPDSVKAAIAKGPAADLSKRKVETLQTVLFSADSIILNLYDNGQVDGDTVTVLLNGRPIISRQGLTAMAITKTIYSSDLKEDTMQLLMYAENLGSIPPNTGLLVIVDGETRNEVRFSSDLQKNSAVLLKRRK